MGHEQQCVGGVVTMEHEKQLGGMLLWDMNNSGGGGRVVTMEHEKQLGGMLLWDMNNSGGGDVTMEHEQQWGGCYYGT